MLNLIRNGQKDSSNRLYYGTLLYFSYTWFGLLRSACSHAAQNDPWLH